jgi:hypothetical protein
MDRRISEHEWTPQSANKEVKAAARAPKVWLQEGAPVQGTLTASGRCAALEDLEDCRRDYAQGSHVR